MHVSGMHEDGEEIPEPTDRAQVIENAGKDTVILVPLLGARLGKKRINVMIDIALLDAIDAAGDNRSEFLAEAAREKLGLI